MNEIVQKVVDLEIEKEALLEENKVTMEILLDYKKNRPVAEKLVVTQRELEKITRQRDALEKEITAKGWKILKLEYEQLVPRDQLADLMKDFRQHLGKYPDIINLMRKLRSDSFLDLTKTN